jgi:predicted nucleotidyltransferase
LPDPTPERRRMLQRDEATKVIRVLDEAGFEYNLRASVATGDQREYEVSVKLERLDGDLLRELQDAVCVVPRARTAVDGWLYVRGS